MDDDVLDRMATAIRAFTQDNATIAAARRTRERLEQADDLFVSASLISVELVDYEPDVPKAPGRPGAWLGAGG